MPREGHVPEMKAGNMPLERLQFLRSVVWDGVSFQSPELGQCLLSGINESTKFHSDC